MVDLSLRTIAIIILFMVVAALALVFIFGVYSDATKQGESYSDFSENAFGNGGLTGKIIENMQRIQNISNGLG